ncbi:MAG: Protein argonaute 10 [Pycnora praestabilis]|nr:MAG: Protein argonaute 10 [Pycnora praestabilis]
MSAQSELRSVKESFSKEIYELKADNVGVVPQGTVWQYELQSNPPDYLKKKERKMLQNECFRFLRFDELDSGVAFLSPTKFLAAHELSELSTNTLVVRIERESSRLDAGYQKVWLGDGNRSAWSSVDIVGCYNINAPSEDQVGVGSKLVPNIETCSITTKVEALKLAGIVESKGDQQQMSMMVNALSAILAKNTLPPTATGNTTLVIHGIKIYDTEDPGEPLDYELVFYEGVASQVSVSSGRFVQSVVPCHKIFFEPMLLSMYIEHHIKDLIFSWSGSSKTLGDLLRGVQVHPNYHGKQREITIAGFAPTNPASTMFNRFGSEISVAEYFVSGKGLKTTHPAHPCVMIGSEENLQYIPTSCCEILPRQSFRNAFPKAALAKLATLTRGLYTTSPASLNVKSAEMLELTAAATVFCIGDGVEVSPLYNLFHKLLKYKTTLGNGCNAHWNEAHVLKDSATSADWAKCTKNRVEEVSSRATMPQVVLAIFSKKDSNKTAYQKFKLIYDRDLRFQSCCINISTLHKCHSKDPDNGTDKYVNSLLRELRAKVESTDVVDRSLKPVGEVLLIEAHVVPLTKTSELASGRKLLDVSQSNFICLVTISWKLEGVGHHQIMKYLQRGTPALIRALEKVLKKQLPRVTTHGGSCSRLIFYRSGFKEDRSALNSKPESPVGTSNYHL